MKVKTKATLLCCAAVFGLGGCFKSVSYDTTLVIRPYVQTENQGPFNSQGGMKAYAFAVDTTDWMVASYEDALAGIITSKHILTEKISTPVAVSEPFPASESLWDSQDWIQMHLTQGSMMMIVVVNPYHLLYAYRQQWLAENLSPFYLAVPFRSWRDSYTDAGWRVVNPYYVPIVTDPDLKPPVGPESPDSESDQTPE